MKMPFYFFSPWNEIIGIAYLLGPAIFLIMSTLAFWRGVRYMRPISLFAFIILITHIWPSIRIGPPDFPWPVGRLFMIIPCWTKSSEVSVSIQALTFVTASLNLLSTILFVFVWVQLWRRKRGLGGVNK